MGTVCSQRTGERQQPLKNPSQALTGELPTPSFLKILSARTLVKFGSSRYALTSHTNSCTRAFICCRLRHVSSESCRFSSSLPFLLLPLLQTLPRGHCRSIQKVWFSVKPARWCATCGAGFGTSALPDGQEAFCSL